MGRKRDRETSEFRGKEGKWFKKKNRRVYKNQNETHEQPEEENQSKKTLTTFKVITAYILMAPWK